MNLTRQRVAENPNGRVFQTYIVRAWQLMPSGKRICMAELTIKAQTGRDAVLIAAADLGLKEEEWDKGSSPPICLRVEGGDK